MTSGPGDIADGTVVCLDASALYLHFGGGGAGAETKRRSVDALVAAIAVGRLRGQFGLGTLAELVHKIMLLEATRVTGRERSNLVRWLREHPEVIANLREHAAVVVAVQRIGIEIVRSELVDLSRAAAISQQYGLLTNDAIIVATMQRLGIEWLATNDDDFARVPWVRVWKPSGTASEP